MIRDLILLVIGGILGHLLYWISRYIEYKKNYGHIEKEINRMEIEIRQKRFENKELDQKLKDLRL